MKKTLLLLFALTSIQAFSQSITSLQYSMGFGTGDLSDYIGSPSFRGFNIDFRKMVQPNIGVGFDWGWNIFYDEKPNDVYELGNFAYSGKQWRYSNQFPLLIAGDYYFQPGEKANPFVGFGLGTMYSLRNTDMGQYRLTQEAWNFAIRPEVGVLYEVKDGLNFSVTGKYYYGFEAGDLDSQGYFTLNFGFVFVNH